MYEALLHSPIVKNDVFVCVFENVFYSKVKRTTLSTIYIEKPNWI